MSNKQQGFTLLEVLIASVILFGTIAIVSQAYRVAVNSSLKALHTIEILGQVPLLLDTIKFRLQHQSSSTSVQQEGVFDDYIFSWSANIKQKGSPPNRFSPENGGIISFDDKFYLWQVELVIQNKGLEKTYSFEHLTWGNALD